MSQSFSKKILLTSTAIVVIAIAGGAVYHIGRADASSPAAALPPPPTVTVEVMEKKPVQVWKEFSGRLRAVDYVELRPQVSGSIQEIRFQDGQIVKKGDVLLVIDPAPYEASAAQARAALEGARNQQTLADKELTRAKELVAAEAISRRIYDERNNAALVAKSQVEAASAQLRQAQIDIGYAFVKAPISGRISRAELTVGNIVQAGANAPVLTTIASDEGIYADFDVDEQTYLQNVYSAARDREAQAKVPVEMVLKSSQGNAYKGVIESFDNHIDPKTGTIRARAFFDNQDGTLLPGMFVNVRLGNVSEENKIMISEKAIGTDQDRKFVYVVNKDNKVSYREISPGASIEGQRIVVSGLQPGDQVITDGIMKLRPDMVVTPKPLGQVEEAQVIEPAAEK